MAGEIKRQVKMVRPTFDYAGPGNGIHYSSEAIAAQMSESIRNVCLSQLQIIERMNSTLLRLDRTLNRIDRRLSQVREFKIQGRRQ